MKTIKFCLLLICLCYLVGCGQVNIGGYSLDALGKRFDNTIKSVSLDASNSNLAEIATPKTIKDLNKNLEQYTPSVQIISPQAEQVLDTTDVAVKIQVENLPLFQDDKLKLGNHLDLILDNEPSRPIFNLEEPVVLQSLTPGTHSIRVFAARPWGESFKNDGAYAQTTFSVLTETNDNRPDPNLPLLTYSNPTGSYGAEPLMLDFYLTNAPLHAVAQNNPELQDWLIRATVNGTSFILENWQPIYLTGFNKGKNWIQLELIDQAGNNIENTFNNTVRVIDYDPQKTDTLAKLVTNKISATEAHSIVEQSYYILPEEAAEIIEPIIEPENNPIEPEIIFEESEQSLEIIELEPEPESTIKPAEDYQTIIVPGSEASATSKTMMKQDSTKSTKSVEESEASAVDISTQTPEVSTENKEEAIPDIQINETEVVIPDVSAIEVEPEKTTEIITIRKGNSPIEEPPATVDIPQSQSIELTEDEIAITIPEIESPNISETPQKFKTPLWLKKILVVLRQKIETLAKFLPSAV